MFSKNIFPYLYLFNSPLKEKSMRKFLFSGPWPPLKWSTGILLLVLLATAGCKKTGADIPAKGPSNKVLDFLESQKIKSVDGKNKFPNKNANIDLLKANVDLNAA